MADRYDKNVKVYNQLKPYVTSPEPDEVHTAEETGETLSGNLWGFLREDKPLHPLLTAELNMKITAAFDAGIRSCHSGNTEYVTEPLQP